VHSRYAVTLLLQTDLMLPGAIEPSARARRATVQQRLLRLLQTQHLPSIEVTGQGQSRLQAAIEAVEALTG